MHSLRIYHLYNFTIALNADTIPSMYCPCTFLLFFNLCWDCLVSVIPLEVPHSALWPWLSQIILFGSCPISACPQTVLSHPGLSQSLLKSVKWFIIAVGINFISLFFQAIHKYYWAPSDKILISGAIFVCED